MRPETFYIAVPEGESPLDGVNYCIDDDIEGARFSGNDLVTESCSGSPMAQIYKVTLELVQESRITVEWDDV